MTDGKKKRAPARRTTKRASKRTGGGSTPATKPDAASEPPAVGPDAIYAFADSVQQVAAAEDEERTAQRLETWVGFSMAGETFALPVSAVHEVIRVTSITRVPHAPFPVRGIINLRGRVVPVVDLRMRIGLPAVETDPKSRILVTSAQGRLLGLLVDEAQQVLSLDMNAVRAAPADVMTEQSGYIIGVCEWEGGLAILLDGRIVLQIPDSLRSAARAAS